MVLERYEAVAMAAAGGRSPLKLFTRFETMKCTNKENAKNREELSEMARQFMRGKVICAAVRLGIPDALDNGESDLHELASRTALNFDAPYRLLRALASIAVVEAVGPMHDFCYSGR